MGAKRLFNLIKLLTWPHIYNKDWGQTLNLSSNITIEWASTILSIFISIYSYYHYYYYYYYFYNYIFIVVITVIINNNNDDDNNDNY